MTRTPTTQARSTRALDGTAPTVLESHVVSLGPQVRAGLDVAGALVRLRRRPGLVALDSAGGAPRRWSIVAFDPFVEVAGRWPAAAGMDALDALARSAVARGPAPPGPFAGGFIGAVSYDLGVRGERLDLPSPAWPQPPLAGGLYRDWIVFRHADDGTVADAHLVLSSTEGHEPAGPSVEERRESVLADLAAEPVAPRPVSSEPPTRHVPPADHRARIESVRDLVAQGEVYQVNLCHRTTATIDADDVDLYVALRETNPGPYMGFLRFPTPDGARGAIVSSSPELLVEVGVDERGRRVARTRPIKGTIGRGATPEEDAERKAALLASTKDLGELAMIVDLERNDLGRVAVPGGVAVDGFPTLETYASVHHLVADVRAELREDVSAVDVLASLFPGGSITGAPKLRAMEAIADIEGEGRGFFTGALGFVDARGRAAFNILIRTFVFRERNDGVREVSFHVGGGITWSSDAAAEDRETSLKAEAMVAALRADVRPG